MNPVSKPGRIHLEMIGLIAIAASVVLLLIVGRSLLVSRTAPTPTRLDLSQAEAIVERASQFAGDPAPPTVWIQRLARGQAAVYDYLLRVVTSYDYLESQGDDDRFIRDVHWIATGQEPTDDDIMNADTVLSETGSRLACLADMLSRLNLAGQTVQPAVPTRLRTLTIDEIKIANAPEVVGQLPIAAEARLTGNEAVFQLFANGRLRQALPVGGDMPGVLGEYGMVWDTRIETAGDYRLVLLVRTSDGRGEFMEIGTYTVPQIRQINSYESKEIAIGADQAVWLEMPLIGEQGQLMVVNSKGLALLEMIDAFNSVVADNETTDGMPAALRADIDHSVQDGSASCYVRISAESAARLTVIAARGLAASKGDGQVFGLLDVSADQVLVSSAAGSSWVPLADYTLTDPTALLSRLELVLPNGNLADIALSFDYDEEFFALVVDESIGQLTYQVQAMEGSAATITAHLINESGLEQPVLSGQPFALQLSENRLDLEITGFDGTQRTVEVNILRKPHSGGYDQTLDLFPNDYQSPLWRLHLLYPSWQFEVFNTAIDWTDFIQAQDERDRSLVNASYSPASWVEADSPVYDGTSWKAAATPVIAHFADPRNFLDDAQIFQFEEMSFNEQAQTRQGLEAILSGTFMEPGNPDGIDYVGIFMDAARTANMSPYYLAARAIQEMGSQGISPLAHGTLDGYEGFYNFYNIGSTPDTSVANGAQINGARYAMYGRNADEQEITPEEAEILLPWDSPQKAIVGGALWIAARYVDIGQDTLYLQKFDLIAEDGLYVHQYAQNIQMAWSEAWNTRKAYAAMGLLDQGIGFSIPVFDNMPADPAPWPD